MIDTRLRNNLIVPAAPADNQLPDILEWDCRIKFHRLRD
jgi:hypothetical protein